MTTLHGVGGRPAGARPLLRDAAILALAAACLLVAITVGFAPIRANGFVWDDWTTIVGTRGERSLSASGLRWAFRSFVDGHYQPLTSLSFSVVEVVGGNGPWPQHLANLVLHLANTLLVAWIAAELLAWAARRHAGADPPSGLDVRRQAAPGLLAAALFALHPLRVESVAWATERRDVLSAFFFLIAVGCYLRRARVGDSRARWYAASLGAYALCLLSKAQATLPLVLLVLDAFPLRRLAGGVAGPLPDMRAAVGRMRVRRPAELLAEKLPFFLLAAVASWLALRAQAAAGALVAGAEHGVFARLAQAAYGSLFYPRAVFARAWYPLHDRPVPLDPTEARFLISLLIALLLTAVLIAWRRRFPAALAVWAVHLAILLPVSGLAQSGVQLVADRYSYLPAVAWSALAAGGIAVCWRRSRSRAGRIACAAVTLGALALWTAQTRAQARIWHDDETLWRHALRGGPSGLAHNNLGHLLLQRGETAAAAVELRRSLEVVPSYARPWPTLGTLLAQGAIEPAAARELVPVLRRALPHQAEAASAHLTFGLALARAGEDAEALAEVREALRRSPGNAEAAFQERVLIQRIATSSGRQP